MSNNYDAAKTSGTSSVAGFPDKSGAEGVQSQKGGTFGIPTATHPVTQPVSLNQAKEKSSNAFISTLKSIVSFFQSIGTKKTNVKAKELEEKTGLPPPESKDSSSTNPAASTTAAPPPVPTSTQTTSSSPRPTRQALSPQAQKRAENQKGLSRTEAQNIQQQQATSLLYRPSSKTKPSSPPSSSPTITRAATIFRGTTGVPPTGNAPTSYSAPLTPTTSRSAVPHRNASQIYTRSAPPMIGSVAGVHKKIAGEQAQKITEGFSKELNTKLETLKNSYKNESDFNNSINDIEQFIKQGQASIKSEKGDVQEELTNIFSKAKEALTTKTATIIFDDKLQSLKNTLDQDINSGNKDGITNTLKSIKSLFRGLQEDINDVYNNKNVKTNLRTHLENTMEAFIMESKIKVPEDKNILIDKEKIDKGLSSVITEISSSETVFQTSTRRLENNLNSLKPLNLKTEAGKFFENYSTKLDAANKKMEAFQNKLINISKQNISPQQKLDEINKAYNSDEANDYWNALADMAALKADFEKHADAKIFGNGKKSLKELFPQGSPNGDVIADNATFFQRMTRHKDLLGAVQKEKPHYIDAYGESANTLKSTLASVEDRVLTINKSLPKSK